MRQRDPDKVLNAAMLLAMFSFLTVTLGTLAVFPENSLPVTVVKFILNQMLSWLMVAGLAWMVFDITSKMFPRS